MDKVTVVTGLFCRARTQAVARQVALGVATVVIVGSIATSPAVASPGRSSGDDPTATSSAIAATQSQVDAVETAFAEQQQTLSQLSEQFDQANVRLAQIDTQLSATEARLALAKKKHAAAHHALQVDAVNAYIYDTPSSQVTSMFSTPSNSTALRDEYQQTAVDNVSAVEAQLASSERQLNSAESVLHTQQQQESGVSTQVRTAQQTAQTTADATEATLSQVKGQLAQLVAQRAAEQAAAAAAAANAAASEAARQRAAAAAAQAAQVAQQFGAGSAAAVQATNAANQAAASAGATGVIGTGALQAAGGAGAAALQGAERYLGVPYEWGGASTAGLDCSGLTMLAWRNAGVDLLHSADIQYAESTHISLSQVRPGDLLFYDLDGGGIDHVVMYVGSGPYGADTIIQAAHTGTVVEFDAVWFIGLVGAGRP